MPLLSHLRRPLFLLLPAALLFSACSSPSTRAPGPDRIAIASPREPVGTDALPRWRAHFDDFSSALSVIEDPLIPAESADSPLPVISAEQLAPALALLDRFSLSPGETILLPRVNGPETPFPDHYPLRQVASLRTIQARRALASGNLPEALSLVRQNLAQARATIESQAGIISLIHAMGVWQCALDGVHSLARSPALPEADARQLLAELQADSRLAPIALDRALRGEYHHVYRVVVERMPKTDDPDLALSAVASLGMADPEPLAAGELGLGLTKHTLLDPAATLAAYQADLAHYLDALAASSRFPRGLYARTTGPTLVTYRRELGAFYDYAGGEGAVTLDLILRARAALESTVNPIGKLLAVYLTPPWEVMMSSAFRREAQRSAVSALLAWRIHGRPAPWSEVVAAGILSSPPADPFSDGALLFETGDSARVWSVYLDAENDGGPPIEGNTGQPEDLVWIY